LRQLVVVAGDLSENCRCGRIKREVLVFYKEATNTTEVDAAEEVMQVNVEYKSASHVHPRICHDRVVPLESVRYAVMFVAHLPHQRLCKFADIRLDRGLRRPQRLDDLPLARALHLPIAQKGRQDLVMPQVLAPRLELLGGLADRLAEPHQGVPEAVRVEVRQPGAGECVAEDRADARGTAPVRPFQPEGLELPRRPQPYARRREQRVVIAPQHLLPQKRHPVRHDLADVIADREEVGGEGLAELRLDLPCILIHAARDEVDVLQLHRRNRAVPRAGQQREGDQGTIRRSISLWPGIMAMTCLACSSVGPTCSRLAVATRTSFSDRLK
jgi:hypothetical protein